MDEKRLAVYLQSLAAADSPFVESVAAQAVAEHVPVVRRETAALLKTLIVLKGPQNILEVGTAVGYSALLMAENAPAGCSIVTIEKSEERARQAQLHFGLAGRQEQITLLKGEAADILKDLTGCWDFIFMDAAKGQYIHFFDEIFRLLAPGGVLVSDNVLQDGTILESRFALKRRGRTIHSRMREYLFTLTHHEGLTTAVLPLGDGVAVSVKTEADSRIGRSITAKSGGEKGRQ